MDHTAIRRFIMYYRRFVRKGGKRGAGGDSCKTKTPPGREGRKQGGSGSQ